MRIVITGASGLLGSKVAELALAAGHDVIAICNQHPTIRGNPVRVDLRNTEEIRKVLVENAPDAVIHAASITDVDYCERNPTLAMETNGKATGTIAHVCNELKSFLVYVSSDYVFDGQTGLYVEGDRPRPVNVYGQSKLLGEQEASNLAGDYCTVRTSVIFGWGREYRPNIATWLLDRLAKAQSLNIINGQFASPTFSTHLAKMLLDVTLRRITGTIHLAGTDRINRYEFAVKLAQEFGYDTKLLVPTLTEAANWYAKRPADSSLNVERATHLLNIKPIGIDDELRAFKLELDNRQPLS
jgi:dTDP-4-dehydrorhamnose reductase